MERTSMSARELAAAVLLGIATYLKYSTDSNLRKYAAAYGVVSALGGLIPALLGVRQTRKDRLSPGFRLLLQIAALAAGVVFALMQRLADKRR